MSNSIFNNIPSSEITPEEVFLNRRQIIKAAAAGAGLAALPSIASAKNPTAPWLEAQIKKGFETTMKVDEDLTPWKAATTYNNFYEFGFGKEDPAKKAHSLKPSPWSIEIAGETEKPGLMPLEDIVSPHQLEERIYRFRCVEAWSMVIPWLGFPLASLIEKAKPTSKAKYVEFTTLYDPEQMPGQKVTYSIDWPYVEGLRMDEAINPLSFMAVGMYGKILPNQNGAPIRLVVPWKYGFKSIKSIVKITFRETMPDTTWALQAPNEYGFYANVNPEVDHPRWSQATERRLPGSLFNVRRIPTLKFNGYEEQVAHLYKGMDLAKFY